MGGKFSRSIKSFRLLMLIKNKKLQNAIRINFKVLQYIFEKNMFSPKEQALNIN